ncbi:hypothetical protein ANANG_G00181920 [Anguilla anguilla]|uniref:VWFD domain-containing protein n=1 Tax=Anguilla anguilla TaxID=7936 RepID=A0A9D3RV36_ANGAN|nr:hypothetical protein ANANG_G00181920 [Anguilla anguilla]
MYNLPLSLDDGAVVAYQNGMHDVIKTNFGLEVTYDLVYKVSVTVPDDYRGKTSGLCGNFNGKRDDDFLLPNGTLAKSVQVFGSAWKVAVPGVICDDGCNGDFCPKCDEKKKVTFERDCALIKKDSGPFAACYGVLDPNSYFRDCVYDVCMSGGDRHALCGSIEAYVSDCQNMGVSVQNWRSPNFCPLSCPANSHYKICAETCATPCPGLPKISSCHSTCAEGCACDDGYSFNGTSCVEKDRCGCFSEGRTYKRGESVISKDCRKKCTCAADGQVQCSAMSCASDEKCLAKDGVLGCYPTQCMLQAGGVFTEFSGMGGILTSVGVYELVSVCPQGTEAEWFRVVVDVRTCEQSSLPAIVAVYVFFEDLFVLVNKNHETWVNGKKVTLPKMLQNEISVKVSDKVVVVERRSGLHLTYNVKQEVSVSVGAHLTDKLCGACGEFTGDTNLFSIFGKPSIQSYMDKWRALDFPSCGLATASTNIL